MPEFPTTPGSLIRATACDLSIPSPYMLQEPEEPDGEPLWLHPGDRDAYRQSDLTLIKVIHDEGNWWNTPDLPEWYDLSDVDKGCALLHAWKADQEGGNYARENYPAQFLDNPVLRDLQPVEACAYVDRFRFDLTDNGGVSFEIDGGLASMTWDEFHRLYELALGAERAR